MNIIGLGYASTLQKPQNLFMHKNLNEGQPAQIVDQNSQFDKLELTSSEASKATLLNTPDKITTEKYMEHKISMVSGASALQVKRTHKETL